MIIILEGVNKTGKTSFLNVLEHKLNVGLRYYNRKHLNNYKNKPEMMKLVTEVQLRTILELTPGMKNNVIFDRFHITEKVYGKIDRGYDMEYFKEIDEELVRQGAKMIYFVDSNANINARNNRDMSAYIDEFDKAMIESRVPVAVFNLRDIADENKIKELLEFLEV